MQGEECKRQLAILFSFIEESQPTESIEVLLGEVDNGQVNNIVVTDPGGGYTGNVPKVRDGGSLSFCVIFFLQYAYFLLFLLLLVTFCFFTSTFFTFFVADAQCIYRCWGGLFCLPPSCCGHLIAVHCIGSVEGVSKGARSFVRGCLLQYVGQGRAELLVSVRVTKIKIGWARYRVSHFSLLSVWPYFIQVDVVFVVDSDDTI